MINARCAVIRVYCRVCDYVLGDYTRENGEVSITRFDLIRVDPVSEISVCSSVDDFDKPHPHYSEIMSTDNHFNAVMPGVIRMSYRNLEIDLDLCPYSDYSARRDDNFLLQVPSVVNKAVEQRINRDAVAKFCHYVRAEIKRYPRALDFLPFFDGLERDFTRDRLTLKRKVEGIDNLKAAYSPGVLSCGTNDAKETVIVSLFSYMYFCVFFMCVFSSHFHYQIQCSENDKADVQRG